MWSSKSKVVSKCLFSGSVVQSSVALSLSNSFCCRGCVLVVVTAVQCPPPENPAHGKAIFTSCSYNSVVSYECDYGYTLVGEASRRCGADKKWTDTMPKCQGKHHVQKLNFVKLLHPSGMCHCFLACHRWVSFVQFEFLILTLDLYTCIYQNSY